MKVLSKSSLFYCTAVLLLCGLIMPAALFAQPDDEPEEEEPVQAYPNPLENEISDSKAMQLMKSQLENMGFTVGQIQKVANGKFVVNVQSWNQVKMKPRFRGSVESTGARIKGARGTGKVIVTVNKSGIYFDNRSFKAMGLKMNAGKLKQAAIVK
ncbi:MAG: hypothetical protein JW822_00190 [Spirochaetales bacterium]|nr:hypothetical protein [Spirochaetales bacterium]